MSRYETIPVRPETKALIDNAGKKGETYDALMRRLALNAISEDTVRKLAVFAIVGESLDRTVSRLADRLPLEVSA